MLRIARACRLLTTVVVLLLPISVLSGCGNGSSSSSVPSYSVVISGASTTRLGATTQFTATVTGTTNTAVLWQVNSITGGNATYGTISATGLYTAPFVLSAATVTITAVLQASATSSGSFVDTLQNPVPALTTATATQVGSSLNYALDVTGSGFMPTSVITIGGVAQTTTYVSTTELTATVAVASGTTSLAVIVSNPNPGAALSSQVNANITYFATTAAAAARFLDQSSFGPTAATIQSVETLGIDAYLKQQFATPTTLLAAIPNNPLPAVCLANNSTYPCAESEWWTVAITGPDQLRQRVAFALSEMFVVSTQSIDGASIPQFHNALANNAFGNFYTIMHDVTLSPAMGGYLNMLNSAKPATVNGVVQIANENYSRENMQLFTIGLDLLNQDGTLQLDGSGNPIPAYTQAQVQAFARAYTGWTYSTAGGGAPTKFPNSPADYIDPMGALDSYHDTGSKTLLNGTVLPAGQTSVQDLTGALTNIFNHPNVGPFVCRQLIQHLVTSSPSPAYVSRVAAVFANDGTGTRGNMKAVIQAILLDTEARSGDSNPSFDGGHLREPMLYMANVMRGLGFSFTGGGAGTGAEYYYTPSNYTSPLSEKPYTSGAVFNFFPPNYVIPGTTTNAPEFDIENTASAVLRLTLADDLVNNKISAFAVDLSATSALGMMASATGNASTDSTNLVNALNTLFMHGEMPAQMQTDIVGHVSTLTNIPERVRVATYLVITSSFYKVLH